MYVFQRVLDIDLYQDTKYRPYGVATVNRLLKIIGLCCRISSLLQGSFAKETCDFKEPTTRSHPIVYSPYFMPYMERWGDGVETQKNVQEDFGG